MSVDLRLDDLLRRRERGEIVCTRFLNESEAAEAAEALIRLHADGCYAEGGYPGALRVRIVFCPEWCAERPNAGEFVSALRISGSAYTSLSHSDFLGSLTGCGISRDVLGDIAVGEDSHSAVVFCDPDIARFLLSEPCPLERVGREKVTVERFSVGSDFTGVARFEDISCTPASMRLDCVVAQLTGISREKVKAMIEGGAVTHNYKSASRADAEVAPGDIISVHGSGKFRIERIGGTTKKGRVRLNAQKYK